MMEVPYKICTKCQKNLPIYEFSRIKKTNNPTSQCRYCKKTTRAISELEIISKNSCYMSYNPDGISIRKWNS